ncbi:aggrecan core protein-like [Antedon mediterranea]|uniref:aggrecan core protein-like n=1 Tax=Antedon mediterranea TaxID=105859 RepID=UPI003AF8D9CE
MIMKILFVLCLTTIQAQEGPSSDVLTGEAKNKFIAAIDKLGVLFDDERDLQGEVTRLAGVVDKLEDLIGNLAQQQDQLNPVLNQLEELEEKVDDIKKCTCSRYPDRVFYVAEGRYTLNFQKAKQACIDRDAVIATPAQLKAAHTFGLDVCAAGWLSDGSVQYPITMPRRGCGENIPSGLRTWGKPDHSNTYDVYCFRNAIDKFLDALFEDERDLQGEVPAEAQEGPSSDVLTCEPKNKFIAAIDKFLDVLFDDERDLEGEVTRLAAVVDKLEDLIGNLAQQQQEQLNPVLNQLEELEEKVDGIKKCTCSRYPDRVFHVAEGRYTLNFQKAKQACIDRDAVIATPAQLKAAHTFGLDVCAAGWLSDGSVQYPITMPRNGCGVNTPSGLRSWGTPDHSKTYNVYCFRN